MRKDELLSWPEESGEPSGALGEALALARKEDASAAQVARLATALAPLYGLSITSAAHGASAANGALGAEAGAAVSATAGVSATTASGAASMKVVLALLATAALGTTGLMSWRAPSAPPGPPPRGASGMDAAPATASPRPAVHAAPPRAGSGAAVAPGAERSAVSPAAAAEPRRAPSTEGSTKPIAKRRAHADPPVEAQLLKEAHAALASDAARALRLADQHRARFPRGALAAERELLAVRALQQQGRADEAQKRIARARRELPRSAPVQRAAERLGALR